MISPLQEELSKDEQIKQMEAALARLNYLWPKVTELTAELIRTKRRLEELRAQLEARIEEAGEL